MPAHGAITLSALFTPREERMYNYNVLCRVSAVGSDTLQGGERAAWQSDKVLSDNQSELHNSIHCNC